MQPARITTAIREEGRDLREGALAEDAPIERTVDDITYSACGDEGNAEQHAKLGTLLRLVDQHPKQENDGHDPEEAQGQLPPSAATKPAKGHAVVLDKQQVEPMTDDGRFLV